MWLYIDGYVASSDKFMWSDRSFISAYQRTMSQHAIYFENDVYRDKRKHCNFMFLVFVALSACIAVQLGYYPTWMFFQCFCAMTLFYCAHWQTYVSGKKLRHAWELAIAPTNSFIFHHKRRWTGSLRFGKVDVTEAQFTIIAIHLISAIFGPKVWMMEVVFFSVMLVTFTFMVSEMFYISQESDTILWTKFLI